MAIFKYRESPDSPWKKIQYRMSALASEIMTRTGHSVQYELDNIAPGAYISDEQPENDKINLWIDTDDDDGAVLSIGQGGTGANNPAGARAALGLETLSLGDIESGMNLDNKIPSAHAFKDAVNESVIVVTGRTPSTTGNFATFDSMPDLSKYVSVAFQIAIGDGNFYLITQGTDHISVGFNENNNRPAIYFGIGSDSWLNKLCRVVYIHMR